MSKKCPLQEAAIPPEDAQPAPIGFREIRFAIPTGTPTVSQSPKGPFGLLLCDWPYTMSQTGVRGRAFPSDNFREIFLETLKGQGYDVAGDPGRFFDEEEDEMRANYAIGGEITDIKMDTCKRSNVWGIEQGQKGEAMVEVKWTVFDLLHRRSAYKTTTRGYGELRTPNYEGTALLFEDALAAAISNLGADKQFYDLIFRGIEPDVKPITADDLYEDPVTKFDPNEEVGVAPLSLMDQPAKDKISELVKMAVMVEAGGGHGSGFFITDQGHIMTNAHVVGNATRVRVVTSGKQDKLIAEVLRIDRKRDVALLKLEELPADLKIKPQPIRTDKAEVGEDVYAIGVPGLKRLQDTVTRGIVSAHRRDLKAKHDLIQADVGIHSGSSGCPLLDNNGNIIGMAVAGYASDSGSLAGLNLFIPISDALDALDISFTKPVR